MPYKNFYDKQVKQFMNKYEKEIEESENRFPVSDTESGYLRGAPKPNVKDANANM